MDCWWDKLLTSEPAIDRKSLNCTQPIDELPEETQATIARIQWDAEQKQQGKIKNYFILLSVHRSGIILIMSKLNHTNHLQSDRGKSKTNHCPCDSGLKHDERTLCIGFSLFYLAHRCPTSGP